MYIIRDGKRTNQTCEYLIVCVINVVMFLSNCASLLKDSIYNKTLNSNSKI